MGERSVDNEHGDCPSCGVSLTGGLIWQTLIEQGRSEAEADAVARDFYGATRTTGRWGRQIAIYSRERDRTVAHRCPDCEHEWEV